MLLISLQEQAVVGVLVLFKKCQDKEDLESCPPSVLRLWALAELVLITSLFLEALILVMVVMPYLIGFNSNEIDSLWCSSYSFHVLPTDL